MGSVATFSAILMAKDTPPTVVFIRVELLPTESFAGKKEDISNL